MFISSTFARYIAVGLLNTAVGYSLYAIFIFFGLHYSLAVLFSTILGVLFNFKTIGKIVFRNDSNCLLLRFIAVYTVTYILNIMGLRIFDYFNFDMYLAGALILIPLAIISFVLHKTFVFRTKGLT
jgi:putative flippase GtrA